MTKEYAIDWKISTYWTAEYEDHGDGTCTLISWYRDGRREGTDCPRVWIEELSTKGRIADVLHIYEKGVMNYDRGDKIKVLRIRNKQHVFSYGREPVVKV